jgi:hypothetical protein
VTIQSEVMDMRALVVVESSFGNTRAIASAVAEGLGRSMAVDVCDIGNAPSAVEDDVDLVVVGGPTHAFGLSRPNTRADAARQAGDSTAPTIGVREWLASAPAGLRRAAAFDTRIDKGWVPGSAAHGIARRLKHLGATLVADPKSFRVVGTPGPLAAGELDRARRWGEQLATAIMVADRPPSNR